MQNAAWFMKLRVYIALFLHFKHRENRLQFTPLKTHGIASVLRGYFYAFK